MKKILIIAVLTAIILSFAACDEAHYAPPSQNKLMAEEPADEYDEIYAEYDEADEPGREPVITVPELTPWQIPPVEISPYGRQVAEAFLSGMASMFIVNEEPHEFHGIIRAETVWDEDRRMSKATGRFVLGWDAELNELITTYTVPEIYIAPLETGSAVLARRS